jgi:cysteine sulfinate desulfinase/cysteine desulfurase-like protein
VIIDLDYNARTPVHARVLEGMTDRLVGDAGNPSSTQQFGRAAGW